MTKGLVTRLVLPLVALVVVCGALHWWLGMNGLWLNLMTELVGILVTVAYVDWVIRIHETRRWQSTNKRVRDRLHFLIAGLISGVRSALGYGPEIFDERVMASADPNRMREEGMRVAREVLGPTVRTRLDTLDAKQWHTLAQHLSLSWNELGQAFSMFESRLAPGQQSTLLDLQDAFRRALTFYSTFPEMAGVSDDQLPRTKIPPELLKRGGYDSTAQEIRVILQLAQQLHDSLE